jgi:hypothetical protein
MRIKFFSALLLMVLGACSVAEIEETVPPQETVTQPGTVTPPKTELSATLQVPAEIPDDGKVVLKFTLQNNTDVDLYVLQWFTPFEGLGGDIFRVTHAGRLIPYQGPLAERSEPTPEAYLWLGPKDSASVEVDLTRAYDFSQAGEYSIEFRSPRVSHVARSEDDMAQTMDELGPVNIPSNQVTVVIND